MEIDAVRTTIGTPVNIGVARASVPGSFDAIFRKAAIMGPPAPEASTDSDASEQTPAEPDRVRAAAEEFISMALVEPVLAKMRSMNQAVEPFAPGAHEKAFGPLVDAAWSKGIVKASNWGLVDRVEQWLRARNPGAEVDHG